MIDFIISMFFGNFMCSVSIPISHRTCYLAQKDKIQKKIFFERIFKLTFVSFSKL